jgi:4-hydroxy-4-methyl-2-oxoglutarate aldolase
MDISKMKQDNMGLVEGLTIHDLSSLPEQYYTFKQLVKGQLSITAVLSDILDEMGYQLMIPASILKNVVPTNSIIIGRVITLRYLPERKTKTKNLLDQTPSRLAHGNAFQIMGQEDVLVVDGGRENVSVLGGLAARRAKARNIQAILINGSCRDIEEISEEGLPVWAKGVTPITGKHRLQAIEINGPVAFCDVHVCHNDIVVADHSGIVFIPEKELKQVIQQLEPLLKAETEQREGSN